MASPSKLRPGSNDGIAISLGPVDEDNQVLKEWITFPVTPTAIPVENATSYADGIFPAAPGSKERARFIGPTLRNLSFGGRLEPPAVYLANGIDARLLGNPGYGVSNPNTTYDMRADILTVGADLPGPPRTGLRDPGVIMEDGAVAGPSRFYEPHSFRAILENLLEEGEVVRLVVGDEYGWNGIATVRSFTWRYEDPDPDVILYDVVFREHNPDADDVASVTRSTSRPKPKKAAYTTRDGDTLLRVAATQMGGSKHTNKLRTLNLKTLAGLHVFATSKGERIGRKPAGKSHPVGDAGAKKLSADRRFAAGIKLKLK